MRACVAWIGVAFSVPGTALAQPAGLFLTPRSGEVRDSSLYGLSADGRLAGGNTSIQNSRGSTLVFSAFSPPFSVEYRVPPFTAPGLFPWDMSDDGGTIVGFARFPSRPFNPEPVVSSVTNGLQYMGVPPGYELGEAYGVSGDGNVVVGYGQRGPGGAEVKEAFRWTRTGGYQMLGRPRPESIWSEAYAATRDGSMIVGEGFTVFGTRDAIVWSASGGMTILPPLPDSASQSATARGVSRDGRFIVGAGTDRIGSDHPLMWGPGGVSDLGVWGAYRVGRANDVSDSGFAAALTLSSPLPASGAPEVAAAVWTQATGTMLLRDYLASNGIAVPPGVTLTGSEAISADGRTIAGNASYFDAELGRTVNVGFVATVPPPATLGIIGAGWFAASRRHRKRP